MDYRGVGIVSPAIRKRYQWRHLVQLVVGCVLVRLGDSRKDVAKRLQSLGPLEIISLLDGSPSADVPPRAGAAWADADDQRVLAIAHEAIPLLAAGLAEHFRRAKAGNILTHDGSMSPWLRGAMQRLASLYVMFGKPVQADGAHTLVAMSARPIRAREWGLPVFDATQFRFHGIHLLDAATRLPTIECIELARQTSSELDLREQQAFEQLETACDLFGARGAEVYTALREFITRHPITSLAEQRRYLEGKTMQLAAHFLASCYEPVQPHHLVNGKLYRCAGCGVPLIHSTVVQHVSCPIRQCKSFESPVLKNIARTASVQESWIAKAHVLQYWCGPGQDEIALYDAATAEGSSKLDVELYPGRDLCDLSLDAHMVGIDVKSHANPFVLAGSFSRGLGGLERFERKIVAINDQAISRFPDYLEILRRECRRPDVEFMSVTALRKTLRARG